MKVNKSNSVNQLGSNESKKSAKTKMKSKTHNTEWVIKARLPEHLMSSTIEVNIPKLFGKSASEAYKRGECQAKCDSLCGADCSGNCGCKGTDCKCNGSKMVAQYRENYIFV